MTTRHPLHESLGVAVIERLSSLHPLPSAGLLGGQSVASCLQEILDGECGPINDIDVFVPHAAASEDRNCTVIADVSADVEIAYGLVHVRRCGSELYRLTGHRRAGLLNTVYYATARSELSDLQVLGGFDLSCVQVGVNLATRRLVWTPAYERFLKTRQIEITLLNTPGRTLLRAMAKRDGLKAYLNVEHAALLCTAHVEAYLEEGIWDDYPLLRLSFGATLRPVWEKYRGELEGLACCVPFEPTQAEGIQASAPRPSRWLVVRRDRSDRRLVACIHELQRHHATVEGTAVLRDSLLRASRRSEAAYASLHRLVTESAGSRHDSPEVWLERLGWKVLDLILKTRGRLFLAGACDAIEVKAGRVARALGEHPSLAGVALKGTLDTVDGLVRAARSAERTHGRWVWGVAETVGERQFMPESLAQAFAEDLAAVLATADEPLVARSSLAWTWPRAFRVRELTTLRDLLLEGEALEHCVGGYVRLVERGTSRIFSLTVGRRRSTLELRPMGGRWWAIQHRSYRNRSPDLIHACLGAAVESVVNGDGTLAALNAMRRVVLRRQVRRMGLSGWGRLVAKLRQWRVVGWPRIERRDTDDAAGDLPF